ncbi:hypothetical protein BDU57DRAFT_514680 [Ampelomyces quisqualis]|uniref:Transmembrane protein n=1 Tax=Ampelomyces quisqualis TaxID=50730 RepID=A0A6A5QU43_AMPQU|nr:hypothetical protein BDU57DRAFT_514680 [Ampelomyces quisqualis]
MAQKCSRMERVEGRVRLTCFEMLDLFFQSFPLLLLLVDLIFMFLVALMGFNLVQPFRFF